MVDALAKESSLDLFAAESGEGVFEGKARWSGAGGVSGPLDECSDAASWQGGGEWSYGNP